MKQKVTVRVLHELREGTSRTTGMPWKSRTAVVGWQETKADGSVRDQLMAVIFRGQHAEALDQCMVQVGKELTLDLDFQTRAFQSGYVSTEITASFPHLTNNP